MTLTSMDPDPSERMYATQTVEGLSLFRDYLVRALGLRVTEAQRTTPTGTVYEFFGDGELSPEEIANQLPDFQRFMGLSVTDPYAAEAFLREHGISGNDATRLVTTYGTRSRRLLKDLRRERENRLISLRQQLEDELEEDLIPTIAPSTLAMIVDRMIPSPIGPADALSTPTMRKLGESHTQLTINVNPQFIHRVEGVAANAFYGNQHIGANAAEILQLIERHNGGVGLTSAVHELEDPDTPAERRLSAGRRLQGFLGLIGDKIVEKGVETGVASLLTYIQSKIGPLG